MRIVFNIFGGVLIMAVEVAVLLLIAHFFTLNKPAADQSVIVLAVGVLGGVAIEVFRRALLVPLWKRITKQI